MAEVVNLLLEQIKTIARAWLRDWREGGFERHVAEVRAQDVPTNMTLPCDSG